MHHGKLHSKQAAQTCVSPWSPEAPQETKGDGAQAGGHPHAWPDCIGQHDLPSTHLLQPHSPPALSFASYKEHFSFWVCELFKNLVWATSSQEHSGVLRSFFSQATYKFLKIRIFNGSADSAWTWLYQHREHWKDKIKGLYKLQLCVPSDFL